MSLSWIVTGEKKDVNVLGKNLFGGPDRCGAEDFYKRGTFGMEEIIGT